MDALDTSAFGSAANLVQQHAYRKENSSATLQFVISAVDLQVIDFSDRFTHPGVCPWIPLGTLDHPRCFDQVSAMVDMDLIVVNFGVEGQECPRDPNGGCQIIAWYAGSSQIAGYNSRWTWAPAFVASVRAEDGTIISDRQAAKPIFRSTDFSSSLGFIPDIITGGQDARLTLARDVVLNVDLSNVADGSEIMVKVKVRALAHNRQAREAYARAMLRDPVRTGGVEARTTGLKELAPRTVLPTVGEPTLPECASAEGQALSSGGSVQFAAPTYSIPEFDLGYAQVFVERVGSAIGTQIVTVSSRDGTAMAGSQYDALRKDIVFYDGDNVPRAITIPIRNDARATGDSALTLELSAAPHCGRIGNVSSTVVTIVDDDQRPDSGGVGQPPVRVTVGGEVTGLVGSGLVLEDRANFIDVAVATNGTYVFDRGYPSGAAYDVRIKSNPNNPAQICTVSNGAGTSTGVSITNVNVSCTTLAPVGSLDPTFGAAGKVTSTTLGAAEQIELQSDGKIVALLGTVLRRFLPDGSPDSSFGVGGSVTVSFGSGGSTRVNSITVQPDGKILATGGIKRTAVDDDFAVARYTADGAIDSGFGVGGIAVIANPDNFEQATQALVQSDGRIVVAGNWDVPPPGQRNFNDFAVVRLTADGSLDPTFGTKGLTTVNIGGRADILKAAALQSDGRIVVTGRVAENGGANPDIGLARFNPDGTLDTSFGTNGIVRRDLSGVGEWDEPYDIVVQADGRIVMALQSKFDSTVPYPFSLARFEVNGTLDTTFGTQGIASTAIGSGNALARALSLQADGKLVVAGQVGSATVNDFGIVRYLTNGALDTSFDGDGILLIDFFAANDSAADVAIQSDGKIVVAGAALNGGGFRLAMVRVIP